VAAVVSRFADRRAALAQIADAGTRAAMNQQIAAEEAIELARLAVEHAAEKRQIRRHVLVTISAKHRELRRRLRQSHRHQRVGLAVQFRPLSSLHDRKAFKSVRYLPRKALGKFDRG
jgi:hypothetical protein